MQRVLEWMIDIDEKALLKTAEEGIEASLLVSTSLGPRKHPKLSQAAGIKVEVYSYRGMWYYFVAVLCNVDSPKDCNQHTTIQ